jgi:hypothetical protein
MCHPLLNNTFRYASRRYWNESYSPVTRGVSICGVVCLRVRGHCRNLGVLPVVGLVCCGQEVVDVDDEEQGGGGGDHVGVVVFDGGSQV